MCGTIAKGLPQSCCIQSHPADCRIPFVTMVTIAQVPSCMTSMFLKSSLHVGPHLLEVLLSVLWLELFNFNHQWYHCPKLHSILTCLHLILHCPKLLMYIYICRRVQQTYHLELTATRAYQLQQYYLWYTF